MPSKSDKFDGGVHQIRVITPEGECLWASLRNPKQWKNDEKKNFLTSIILTEEEAQPIVDQSNGLLEALKADMPKNVKMSPHEPWEKQDDGRIKLKFKRPFFEKNDRLPATPPITTYMPDDTKVDWDTTDWEVGNGSRIKIGGFIRPYYNPALGLGISLRLDAVKVVSLEKYTGSSDGGFDKEFGGGESANSKPSTKPVTASDF